MTPKLSKDQQAARQFLGTLMGLAFIEIRATAYVGAHLVEIEGLDHNERIRLLADMFHNVPGQMTSAAEKDGNYQKCLDLLWECTGESGRTWLYAVAEHQGVDRTSPLIVVALTQRCRYKGYGVDSKRENRAMRAGSASSLYQTHWSAIRNGECCLAAASMASAN